MNVTTRDQFDAFLTDLAEQKIKVFDTETNGLRIFKDQHMVSLSVYFPAVDRSYNLPFFHGVGSVEVKYTDNITPDTAFADMTWQGKAKKQVYLGYWFNHFKKAIRADLRADYFQNLPVEWLDEVRAAWGKGIYIGHNTRFDAHVLHRMGFPDMEMVYDTMVSLHIVNEDWRHIKREAPFTWTQKDAPAPELWGQWARDEKGNLLIKEQWGNRQLKWQAAAQGIPHATEGEEQLSRQIQFFRQELAAHIVANIKDPMNESLLIAAVKKNKATPADMEKQFDKIFEKLDIDDKAHLWMLPSWAVAEYAELDVRLTWGLWKWCEPIIIQWHNEKLLEDQSHIHHFVAWEMERNGFRLDVEQAHREIDKLNPRIEELEATLAAVAVEFGMDEFNPNSPKQLLQFLNSGVLAHDYGTTLFPDWWDEKNKGGLRTYNFGVNEFDLEDQINELAGTDKRELEKVEDHPVVRLLKELRRMHKTVSTYLTKWLSAVDGDGIVHGSIDDTGTVAGRASSSGDAGNQQNIPDRGGYTVKRAVVPYGDEWRLLAWDYGQLELRLAAWIAEGKLGFDKNMTMTNLFLSGEDMHSYVRDMIDVRRVLFGTDGSFDILTRLGYNQAEYTADKAEAVVANYTRQVAKTMNFGLLYSGGARMLSKLLKLDEELAKELVFKWRDLFPAFSKAQEYYTKEARRRQNKPDGTGTAMYVTQPISGRHRKLHMYSTSQRFTEDGVNWQTYNPQEAAARKTWNNTVQGLGGYLAMYSAYLIGEKLGRTNLRLFANIHDALEGQVHIDHMHLVPQVAGIMTDWPEIVPNLTVDVQGSIDGTWQGMTKIKNMQEWIETKGEGGY